MTKIKQQPALVVVFLTSVLLVIDLFLPWQEVDGKQTSGFHGVGIAAMVFVAFVVVESSLQACGVIKKIPIPPPILILLPSFAALILIAIRFSVDSDGRQPAAWTGLALGLILVAAAILNALVLIKMTLHLRKVMKAQKTGSVAGAASTAAAKPAASAAKPPDTEAATGGGASCDGDWALTMDTPMGTQHMTLTLMSQGSELSGKADTPFGDQEFEGGIVKGDNIAWEVEATTPMPMTLTFKATISGDDLRGTANVAGMGETVFTGTRIKN